MSNEMNQEGVTKARPKAWKVFAPSGKKSVAVSILFQVESLHNTETGEWDDWREYDVQIAGSFWVIGKDGQPLTDKVEQLAQLLGWNGDLMQIVETNPPDIVLQVTSKRDDYQGQTRFRADWIAAEDADPTGGGGASREQVQQIQTQFGSLLRAAAAGAKKPQPKAPEPKATTTVTPTNAPEAAAADDYSDIPF